ncbi:sigma E protease regulator RseP [Litorilituus lipolyticus]|uniref:Zinc metalloprotease n=1 Tax=Litorilituus lipolyticus TaxID=2491017 RepID=A0A502KQE8_9GAMM|nr:sigma E protease regulator RseP [Litorilituus lipolyticus]TPH13858.1 sigma E protease regulator RseP [Litorilituus lipolyticus]
MFDFFWNLASFVVALGILVTVHEYGHFWVARKNGVKVERFSVGFGKAIWRKTGKDGTEYVLAMIPLGGYVKMLDERVDEVAADEKDKTFNSKSVYQRIAIIAAGPLANFAFAIFAFYLMFLIGVPSIKPIIGHVDDHSIAAQANVPANVEIVSVAGHSTLDWQAVNLALIGEIGSQSIEVKARGSDSQYISTYVLNTSEWQFSPDKTSALASLGIIPFRPQVFNELAVIGESSPAEKAGLQVGDKLLQVNGQSVEGNWQKFSELIKTFPNEEVKLTIERSGKTQQVFITPEKIERAGKSQGYIGVSPKFDKWPEHYRINLAYGPIDAVSHSLVRTWDLTRLTFSMIGKLITGDVSVKNLSGPIGIAQGAGNSAGFGIVYFLGFLALISINLGIINLLPLPVLDGGHLLYYLIELLTGKPVPDNVQEAGFKFGAIALLLLMAIGLFNDFSRVLG